MTFGLTTKAPTANTARETSTFANTTYVQERASFQGFDVEARTDFGGGYDFGADSKLANVDNFSGIAQGKMLDQIFLAPTAARGHETTSERFSIAGRIIGTRISVTLCLCVRSLSISCISRQARQWKSISADITAGNLQSAIAIALLGFDSSYDVGGQV